MALAKKLEVEVEPLNRSESELLLHINGKSILPSEWANSEVNKLSETEKNILPSQLMSSYITANNPRKKTWTK